MTGGGYDLVFTADARAFLDLAGDHLAADPVRTTVVSTMADRAVAEQERGAVPVAGRPHWWLTVLARDRVVGAAMRTAPFAPHPLFVLPMPDAAAREVAGVLHGRGEAVRGINGALPSARVLAEETARLRGGSVAVHQHTRLFELNQLREPPPVPGRLRPARSEEAPMILAWFVAFVRDADQQAGRAATSGDRGFELEDVRGRIEGQRVWLWEDGDGRPVHLTGTNPPSFGVARVGPVYTLPQHRGRGYASAAVAAVSRGLRHRGARVCLFTDQANPASNRVYQALGFEPVTDMADLVVTDP